LLSPEKKKQALYSLMNIVEKRDGRVNAWAVADGSKEHTLLRYKKEDASLKATYSINFKKQTGFDF
jgi:hypothetical protein